MVLMPQSGYIHPDEFFQSVEVVTGDVLSTDTIRTWEFNVTAPIRFQCYRTFSLPLTVGQNYIDGKPFQSALVLVKFGVYPRRRTPKICSFLANIRRI